MKFATFTDLNGDIVLVLVGAIITARPVGQSQMKLLVHGGTALNVQGTIDDFRAAIANAI
jgi:hypothetical protein